MRPLFILGLLAFAAFAADITGTWSGSMATPNEGGVQVSFTFKQQGAKLTGTYTGPQGDRTPIHDGKVDGNRITFAVTIDGATLTHEGSVRGDEINLTSKSDQGAFHPGPISLKRVK